MKRNPTPVKLDHAGMLGDLDSRELPIEQHPWTPHLPFTLRQRTLPFGDFTLPGLDKQLIYERKAKQDFIGCVGKERERFDKVITAMRGYRWPFLIIEATWEDLESANWRGEITSAQAIGAMIGWQCHGIHVVLAGTPVVEAAVRSWKPLDPFCLRWDFPVFHVDASLNTEDIKQDRKRAKTKGEKEAEWTPEKFAEAFATNEPKGRNTILTAAEGKGLSNRKATSLFTACVEVGLIHKWHGDDRRRGLFATVPPPEPQEEAPSEVGQ